MIDGSPSLVELRVHSRPRRALSQAPGKSHPRHATSGPV